MLSIRDLHVEIDGTEILKGVTLDIEAGKVHAIMGPNGSGKSTLANVIVGKDDYEITKGDILFEGKSILEMDPDERAQLGIFLGFQYPAELPGVNNHYFLRSALNAILRSRGEQEVDALEFYEMLQEKMKTVKMDSSFLNPLKFLVQIPFDPKCLFVNRRLVLFQLM